MPGEEAAIGYLSEVDGAQMGGDCCRAESSPWGGEPLAAQSAGWCSDRVHTGS